MFNLKPDQTFKLVEQLEAARLPVQEPVSSGSRIVRAVSNLWLTLWGQPLPSHTLGRVPHGVENLPVTIHRVQITENGSKFKFCNIRGVTVHDVPIGDNEEYPEPVEVSAVSPVKDGWYNAKALLSINGTLQVKVQELEPCNPVV